MGKPSQPKSLPPCKVILLHRAGGRMRFGVENGSQGTGFPAMPFPDLMAIDRVLERFTMGVLGLGRPRVHARFVERPDPTGSFYYLVEEEAQPDSPAQRIDWLQARNVAERVGSEDRRALARAIGYLSGQRFGKGGAGDD